MRGWLALIHRQREVHQQIPGYSRLLAFLDFLRRWLIVLLDERAADQFTRLRRQRIRIGTEDLKMASIALVQDALLLSANLRDFHREVLAKPEVRKVGLNRAPAGQTIKAMLCRSPGR